MSALMRRNTTFGELKNDLVDMRSRKDLYSLEAFIKKYEELGISHGSLETIWRVTQIGYCAYEFTMPDFTRSDIVNFQEAGFIVKIHRNPHAASLHKGKRPQGMLNSEITHPILVMDLSI